MFTPTELRESLQDDALAADLDLVRSVLVNHRIGHESDPLDNETTARLMNLVVAVLASAPSWAPGEALDVLESAAQSAEVLALLPPTAGPERIRLRAALLYELAAMPMMAAAAISEFDRPHFLVDFFKRRHAFGSLGEEVALNGDVAEADLATLLRLAACEDALSLAKYEHDDEAQLRLRTEALLEVARHLSVDMSMTEVLAFTEVIERRAQRSTRLLTPTGLLRSLRTISFPPELWDSQVRALDAGLLDPAFDAWGLAAPTGTGKTFLARLLVIDSLSRVPDSKILYLVPTKALVHQVSQDLSKSLRPTGIIVTAVTPQITALDTDETDALEQASVLVLTPEKADLLLRIGADFLKDVALVVVDEAHHIEDGTRGVLLELYLARLRTVLAEHARYVLLSAVAPNIRDLTDWIGDRPGSVLVEQRSTRMKVGIYRIERTGRFNAGFIDYTDGTRLQLFERGAKKGQRPGLVQLTARLGAAGPVLVVAQGKKTTENVAMDLHEALEAAGHPKLTEEQLREPAMARLDSRLEREMYADVELRRLIRFGIAYHHAGLPPRVREALEAAITENLITHVIATTTLAEGVNFPFSTVIVQSLAIKNPTFEPGKPMSWRVFTPRKFWNIAGRAGRPGSDHEGQVILYESSLGLERVDQVIDPYIEPGIRDIPAVESALARGLKEIRERIADGTISFDDLAEEELSSETPKTTRGVVNLVRVGLAHARASGITDDPDTYFGHTLAARTLPREERDFARRIVRQQEAVLSRYLADDGAPSIQLVAELGLSIDTLSRLQRYIRALEDWQLEAATHVLFGGSINFRQLPYLLSSVLANMAELEGRTLSGWYSKIVEDWCYGKPFSQIALAPRQERLEDLIGLMYSEIQYMLPWGLYAADRFIAEEAVQRRIPYDSEVNQLAYLVDAGVPNWPALHLTTAGFERTDAARLSRAYLASREARETADILGWLVAQSDESLAQIVRGVDRRRMDYDFEQVLRELRGGPPRRSRRRPE